MTTLDEKVEGLKLLKDCLKDPAAGTLLEPLLTTTDLERLLKVDRRTITRLVKRGELPAPLKLGGSNRWRPENINAAIDRLGHRAGRRIGPATNDGEEKPRAYRLACEVARGEEATEGQVPDEL
jgi:predicted DNA-binding transcriptional regulator AlpA